METFQSRDELKKAYARILKIEESLKELIDADDEENIDLEKVDELVSEQSDLMNEIEKSPSLDEQFRNEATEFMEQFEREFKDLRAQNRKRLKDSMVENGNSVLDL
ncbi:MAG: hypothetical protein ABEJ65_08800 [bacterium]